MVVALEPARSSNGSDKRWAPVRRVVCTLGAAALLCGCPAGPDESAGSPGLARVEYVVDGDTVDVTITGQSERVRLIGIDTPESVNPSVPVQCFGKEASDALTGLLPPGTELRIERDAEARDRFGRLLLYLYRTDDGLFVNQWLLEQGFADTLFFEPNTTFEGPFTRARNDARANGLGLWSACDGPDQPLE